MPTDYRNSLGYLALQLKADRLKQQQAEDFQREQISREESQRGVDNALAIGKQQMALDANRDNRQLQLADMLTRVKLQEEGKTARQDDKQAYEADKMAAQVAKLVAERMKNKAQISLIQEQTRTVGADDKRQDLQLAQDAQIAATNAGTKVGPDGKPILQVDPSALLPGVTPRPEGPSDVIPFTASERTKAQEDLRKAQAMLPTIQAYTQSFQSLKPEDFDAAKAQKVPIIGNLLEKAGLPASGEDLQRARVNKNITGSIANFFAGEPTQGDREQLQRKDAYTSAAQKFKSDYARLVSGLTVTEQEQKRLDEITAKLADSAFENDPVFQAAAINQFTQTYNEILANYEADLKDGGMRMGRRAPAIVLGAQSTQTTLPQTPVGQRREPPPQTVPGPLDTQEDPAAARKRRIEIGRTNPEIKAKLKAARDALPPDMSPEQKGEALHKILEQLVP